jgi:hypothetical protein
VEGSSGEQLELFIKQAPRQQLLELPPVIFPPHQGNKKCKHCRAPHASALHRFHLKGAFDRSHPGPARAEVRRKQQKRDRERWQEEIPF